VRLLRQQIVVLRLDASRLGEQPILPQQPREPEGAEVKAAVREEMAARVAGVMVAECAERIS
jgi:hypothetical protein